MTRKEWSFLNVSGTRNAVKLANHGVANACYLNMICLFHTCAPRKMLEKIKYIFQTLEVVPVDPVCGIEMDQELAVSHEHNGKTYYFCCEGCKRIFVKKPGKYSK